MKTKPAYLVIDTMSRKGPTIRRATQLWPNLEGGEICVRVSLEIPDDLLPNVQRIVVQDPDAIVIGVEPEPIET